MERRQSETRRDPNSTSRDSEKANNVKMAIIPSIPLPSSIVSKPINEQEEHPYLWLSLVWSINGCCGCEGLLSRLPRAPRRLLALWRAISGPQRALLWRISDANFRWRILHPADVEI